MNLYKVTYIYEWSTATDTGSYRYYSAKNLKDLGGYIEDEKAVVSIEYLGQVKIVKN